MKKVIFTPDGRFLLSAAEDMTVRQVKSDVILLICSNAGLIYRMWEVLSGMEVAKATLPQVPNNMQLSQDGSILTVTCGRQIYFYSVPR